MSLLDFSDIFSALDVMVYCHGSVLRN